MFWKKHKRKLILAALLLAALAAAYFYGGGAPGTRGWRIAQESAGPTVTDTSAVTAAPTVTAASDQPELPADPEGTPQGPARAETEVLLDAAASAAGQASAETAPAEVAEQPATETEAAEDPCHCTLSVRCDMALAHLEWLDASVAELLPEDGEIFPEMEVAFSAGESVFDVLCREMQAAGIHIEFSTAPVYGGAYIEGICNLYEFDCGELSGWMYRVNGVFPNYASSQYALSDGDVVEWLYTCDLGADISE